MALLGPNGAGKTTLLRAALGLLSPCAGWIRLHGLDVQDPDSRLAALRRTGATIEQPGLPTHVEPLAYLAWWARLHGMDSPGDRARDLLAAWGIPATGSAERLSQGQRQILQILRCLVHEPELLVLDEPTSFLDPDSRARFDDGIRQWRTRTGGAVLLSTHHLDSLGGVDRLVLLSEGRLRRAGPPEDLLGTHEFTRLLRLDPSCDLARAQQALESAVPAISAVPAGIVRGCPAWRVACGVGEAGHASLLGNLAREGVAVRSLDRDDTTLREFWDAAIRSLPIPTVPTPAPRPEAPVAGGVTAAEAWRSTLGFHLALIARERRLLVPVFLLELFFLGSMAVAVWGASEGLATADAVSMLLLAGLLPLGLSTSLASDTFAGERERRSLETLLCAPIPPLPLFLGKGLAALIPGQILSWLGFAAATALLAIAGSVPSPGLLAVLGLLVLPSMGLLCVGAALTASRRARTVRAAAQLSAMTLLPLLAGAQILPRFLETGRGASVLGWAVTALLCAVLAGATAVRAVRTLTPSRLLLRT
jgi:ABC-type multidrug transport system ATPase subunit